MRFCFPCSVIDWSEEGGLCYCNWPFCDDMNLELPAVQIRETNRIVITFERPLMPPGFFMCFTMLVPGFGCMIACDENATKAMAWEFTKLENGNLRLRLRKKVACSENIILEIADVNSVTQETTQVTNPSTGFNQPQARLCVTGAGAESVQSPYINVTNDAFSQLAQMATAMLPER